MPLETGRAADVIGSVRDPDAEVRIEAGLENAQADVAVGADAAGAQVQVFAILQVADVVHAGHELDVVMRLPVSADVMHHESRRGLFQELRGGQVLLGHHAGEVFDGPARFGAGLVDAQADARIQRSDARQRLIGASSQPSVKFSEANGVSQGSRSYSALAEKPYIVARFVFVN